MTIKRKFGLFALFIVTIFIMLSLLIYKTIDDIRINGNTYAKILLGNNLIADILPPPNYIIESYLVSYELLFNISDTAKVSDLIEYLEKRLIPEYQARYAFWINDTTYFHEDGDLKSLYKKSDEFALKYYEILAEEYIPAIQRMDSQSALAIFSEKLKPNYDEHRKAVDALVLEANRTNSGIEVSASKTLLNAIIIMAVVAIAYLILFGVIIGALSKNINSALNKNVMILKNISEGDGDLTRQIQNNSKDELGEMAKYFNLTMSKIRSLIILVQQQSAYLDDVGMRLSSNMTETAAAIHEITANTQSIKNQMLNQSSSVTETSATMDQISKGIEKLDRLIDEQSANVTESSSAIEEMMANIGSVTQTLIKKTLKISIDSPNRLKTARTLSIR